MSYDFSRVRCLICDDSPQMRKLVDALLREVGLTDTHHARDGEDAWDKIATLKPHLLIIDWNMGDGRNRSGDGLAFVQELRQAKDSPNRYLPVMMLTGYTEKHRVEQARNAGVHDLIAKPVTAGTLYKHLYQMAADDRDFILTKSYFGPDRRRAKAPPPPDGKGQRAEDMGDEDNTS